MNVSYRKQIVGTGNDVPVQIITLGSGRKVISTASRLYLQSLQNPLSYEQLNINSQILKICNSNDLIIVATSSYIMAIEPSDTSTVFYKPNRQFVTALEGNSNFSNENDILVFVGDDMGSVTGLDLSGNEVFWAVLPSRITGIVSFNRNIIVTSESGQIQMISTEDNEILKDNYVGEIMDICMIENHFGVMMKDEIGFLDGKFRIQSRVKIDDLVAMEKLKIFSICKKIISKI